MATIINNCQRLGGLRSQWPLLPQQPAIRNAHNGRNGRKTGGACPLGAGLGAPGPRGLGGERQFGVWQKAPGGGGHLGGKNFTSKFAIDPDPLLWGAP
jgi:hypothetical protein